MRIAGVNVPDNKRVQIALTYIYGIGKSRAATICEKAGVNIQAKVRDLTEEEAGRVRQVIQDEGRVEGDLRKEVQLNIKRLMDIGCYRSTDSARTPMPGPARVPRRGASAGRSAKAEDLKR